MGVQHMVHQSNHLWQQNKHFNTFGAGSLCIVEHPKEEILCVLSCASANLCPNIVVPRQAGAGKKTGAGDSETK